MSKKTFLSIFFITHFSLFVIGQRVDIDDSPVVFNLKNLPFTPLSENNKSYSVGFLNSTDLKNLFTENEIISKIQLEGFKKFISGGDFKIVIEVNQPLISKNQTTDKTTTSKDKNDKIIYNYAYIREVEVMVPMRYRILTFKGDIIAENVISEGNAKLSYTSSVYSSQKEADNAANAFLKECLSGYVSEKLNNTNKVLNKNYGYYSYKITRDLQITDSKKHPENTPFIEMTTAVTNKLNVITPESLPPIGGFQDAIDYFIKVADTYKSDDKSDKKLRHAAYTNIGIIYFFLEKYDLADEYFKKVISNDFRTREAENYIKEAIGNRDLLKRNQYKSFHYVRNLDNVVNPEEVIKRAEQEKLAILSKKQDELNKSQKEIEWTKLNKSIQEKSTDPTLYITRGDLYMKENKIMEALSDYSSAINLAPNNNTYLQKRIDLNNKRDERNLMIEDYKKMISNTPNNEHVYSNLILAYKLQKEPQKVVATYDEMYNNTKQNYALMNKGEYLYSEMKDYEAAHQTYSKALINQPSNSEAYIKRGMAGYFIKKYKEAIEDFTVGLSDKDLGEYEKREAYQYKGMAEHELGDYEQAIKDLKSSAKVKWTYPSFANIDMRGKHQNEMDILIEKSKLALSNQKK